jgi:hypothetical protein
MITTIGPTIAISLLQKNLWMNNFIVIQETVGEIFMIFLPMRNAEWI